MAFVTTFGSLKINTDITYDKWDPKAQEYTQIGNKLPTLHLTEIENFDFQPNGALYKEMVWRGQPDPAQKCWNDTPVFKILTSRFKTGKEWIEDKEERHKTDWGRFMRDYEFQLSGIMPTVMFYEPDINDIRVDNDTNAHFPIWVINKLVEWDEFSKGLVLNKVNIPGVPRLTKQELDRIMKEIKQRKAEKIGNVSRSSEPSTSKAS